MAKQDILFGTTALSLESMGLIGNITRKSKMETPIRVIYLAVKHL